MMASGREEFVGWSVADNESRGAVHNYGNNEQSQLMKRIVV